MQKIIALLPVILLNVLMSHGLLGHNWKGTAFCLRIRQPFVEQITPQKVECHLPEPCTIAALKYFTQQHLFCTF